MSERRRGDPLTPVEVVSVDLAKLFTDSAAGTLHTAAAYETVYGIIPLAYDGAEELALDANEDQVYFRMLETAAAPLLPPGTEIAADFGPRGMTLVAINPNSPRHGRRPDRGRQDGPRDWPGLTRGRRAVSSRPYPVQPLGQRGNCFLLGNRRKSAATHLDRHGRWHRAPSLVSRK